MKKIAQQLVALVKRLAELNATEPVLVRGGIAAVLNVLVESGVITLPVSSAVQAAILATLTLILLVSTRQSVTPTVISDLHQVNAYLKGHEHAAEIVNATEKIADAIEGKPSQK